jgi:SAM-dependent methyltransferase
LRVQRERRLSFGEVAELYDRTRPSYPEALVDDVVAFARLRPGDRVLEVGAGTGRATVLVAARGISIAALEPSPQMAAIARRNCRRYPNVTIEEVEFEHWRPPERFRLLISAQAWHWITPELRYVAARAALADGGALAAFWNIVCWDGCPVRDELRDAYRRQAPELARDPGPMYPREQRPDPCAEWKHEIGSAHGFERPEVRSYSWSSEYATDAYVSMLRTHSDHIVLARDRREGLLAAVGEVLDRNGGTLRVHYVTHLCLARASVVA